ncbi:putative mitochondrial hypothetical protein [Leptomonas pyrrhocoris]|uniref:Uncharacterized protein n=1 Tax=Leptomonas pyrrhocoris TaxID=157538 RepID=A0A0N0E0L9_LEPPY|nr:putative mitochondrial hypothetical protein [Leptomonas pyrrhocoris]XP_015665040.1 putative mitochondrial hypothetical protein [Leptomonas pyrrhocoris]XP_015665041.1 putative mitochondrial hypothetical protein [Leptomonas pyrrhocoris]KPA86600.1 putative mitochondrial hypothetical protein [Leptomonas pyrrhocoris]KPA86601.1 putative mitochondrial hypothetical protein [Leptomonas pyrrhocoris]KPA86602.1 putative mitochondrial hypothetical protein [Leptomonas pyrrhocoris]|eukprot:XP_015665039.1 putative mitochondrial hypothetical protein [Leptomonas pyrrhocoris]
MRPFLSLWRRCPTAATVTAATVFTSTIAHHRCFVRSRQDVTEAERQHLEQELPPRELLREMRTSDRAPGEDAEDDIKVPGDSFGIMQNRVAFYKPIPRQVPPGPLGELMPVGTHPYEAYNQDTVRLLCSRYGVKVADAVKALREAKGDINLATELLERWFDIEVGFGSYGVVCLESYAPETFCLVSFNLPTYASTQNDEVLDVIHELTLSAAEMPLDTPRGRLVDKFVNHWTTEDDVPCGDVLKACDITVQSILLLPFGDYGVQGFHVLKPVKDDAPNIGLAAAACCMDLRTGIHNRFRFHVERMADSVSEHVLQEMLHYNQGVHVLRQPYWFRPEYSVEEFLRFKESLLQPSASTFEMRYAFMFAPQYGLPHYRNIVEMEKLKIAQHKYEKHYEDFTAPGKWLTSDNAQLQTVAAGSGGSNAPGGAMHNNTNNVDSIRTAMETRAGPLRRTLEKSMQAHGDRVFNRFYRNNAH